ncbi:hypothetical protein EDD86DRAFT_209334 [Gorgonomyces haynaldii]|nr:hypothetical protein EDD86DRAFT_209334 [Gorgonomyces haynaldii]
MQVVKLEPQEFLDTARTWLDQHLIDANVLETRATAQIRFKRNNDYYVILEDQTVVGVFTVWTDTNGLFIPKLSDPVVDTMRAFCDEHLKIQTIEGPVGCVDRYCQGKETEVVMLVSVYVLDQLIEKTGPGSLIDATDLALEDNLVQTSLDWTAAFANELNMPFTPDRESQHRGLVRGAIAIYSVNNKLVSTASISGGGQVGRIGCVYTPPQERGNGYASHTVSLLCKAKLEKFKHIMLFADEMNPVSNKIYQNIGFKKVDSNKKVKIQ